MTQLVLDASAGVEWVLPEAHRAAADRLLESASAGMVELVVPDLFYVETSAALWKRVRRRELDPQSARRAMRLLAKAPLILRPALPLLFSAADLALEYHITFYDAVYVAIARELDATLVTTDERLLRALAGHPVQARHLQEQ